MLLRTIVGQLVSQQASEKLQSFVTGQLQKSQEQTSEEFQTAIEQQPIAAVVIFPTSIESGGFYDRLSEVITYKTSNCVERTGLWKSKRILVVETGTGLENTKLVTQSIIDSYQPRLVIVAGFSVALKAEQSRFQVVLCDKVSQAIPSEKRISRIDLGNNVESINSQFAAETGECLSVEEPVHTKASREKIAAEAEAIVCDMESFAAVKACVDGGVPCFCLRIISDEFNDEKPKDLSMISTQDTIASKLGATAAALWKRPKMAMDALKYKERAIEAGNELAKALFKLISQI